MSNVQQCAQILREKEMLNDLLASQKQITASYNTFAGECVNPSLRNAFLNILGDEHQIQADIFSNLQANGWYQPEQAEQQKIQQTQQKLSQQQ